MDTPTRPLTLALGGLIALAAAMGIGRFIYTPILPVMVEALNLTQAQAGLIASANFAGYLVGALLTALPVLPGSRRVWLLVALAASAASTGAMGLDTSLAFHLAMRVIGGIASAVVLVLSSALILDRLAAMGRSDLSAVHFAGVGVGIAASAAIVAALIAAGSGWRHLWFAGSLMAFAALALVAALVPADPAEPPATVSPERSAPASDSRLTRLVIAYGLFGFGYVITATFIVSLVRATPEMRPLEPLVWLVVGLTAIPSVALWTAIGRKVGVDRAFALACVVEAVGVAASVLWATAAGAIAAAALLGGTFMGISALGLIDARRLSEGDPRRVLAIMSAAFGLGQIIGPAFAGWAFDATGSLTAPTLSAAAALLVAAMLAIRVSCTRT